MGKERQEEICFNNLKINSGKYITKSLRELNSAHRIADWEESPDFLAILDNTAFGIEHFTVDQVYIAESNRSTCRLSDENAWDIYGEHHEAQEKGTYKAEEAGKDISELIQCALDYTRQFDYDAFLCHFTRVFEKHVGKIDRYCANMGKYSKIKLYFLIELDSVVFNESHGMIRCYGIRRDGAKIRLAGNGIIITEGMLEVIKKQIGNLEGIILQSYSLLDLLYGMNQMVYLDLRTEMSLAESLKEQRIEVYKSFYIEAPNIELKLEMK